MKYYVISYIGDFPVAHQPTWDIEYPTLKKAIKAAKKQHIQMILEYPELYTVVMKGDEDTKVEWIMSKNLIIENDSEEATKLADKLMEDEDEEKDKD